MATTEFKVILKSVLAIVVLPFAAVFFHQIIGLPDINTGDRGVTFLFGWLFLIVFYFVVIHYLVEIVVNIYSFFTD